MVDDGHGLTIDEYAGNVASSDDRISIAHVKVAAPTSEPWLTLDYDEWMVVLKGRMVLLSDNGTSQLEVVAGQTVFIAKDDPQAFARPVDFSLIWHQGAPPKFSSVESNRIELHD